jgi:hypothetical protein
MTRLGYAWIPCTLLLAGLILARNAAAAPGAREPQAAAQPEMTTLKRMFTLSGHALPGAK